MILVDANVIIDFWRNPRDEVAEVLDRSDLCLCGVTLAELMHGALDEADGQRIENEVAGFPRVSIEDEDWPALGRNLFLLRRAGLRVPFQDVLLATVAIRRDLELWSLDIHCTLMQKVLKDLRLFSLA